jgi:peroxin-7
MNGPPSVLQTPGFAHYFVAWSPFHTSRLALASAANFGLVGNGRLHLVSVTPGPGGLPSLSVDKQYVCRLVTTFSYLNMTGRYDTQDGIYDVAWSEIHENQLVTGSGDGSIKLWDAMLNVGMKSRSAMSPPGVNGFLGSSHSRMARAQS